MSIALLSHHLSPMPKSSMPVFLYSHGQQTSLLSTSIMKSISLPLKIMIIIFVLRQGKHTVLSANPFIGVIMTPTGLVQVGRPAGYISGYLLYSKSTRVGTENAANFPSPVAVQQSISSPSRIAEMRSSWTTHSPLVHLGMSFLTIVLIVTRPRGSCQHDPQAIFKYTWKF